MRYSATSSNESTASHCKHSSVPATSNPMELLTHIFGTHPTALRLHRQLIISLANGDAESAVDLASILAHTIRKVLDKEEKNTDSASSMESDLQTGKSPEDKYALPLASSDDLDESMAIAERQISKMLASEDLKQLQSGAPEIAQGVGSLSSPRPSFWRSPDYLCITTLESIYEAVSSEGGEDGPLTVAGERGIVQEGQEMAILDQYLVKEAGRLSAQKNAVAKTILEVARALDLMPEDLHAAEGASLRHGLVQPHSQQLPGDASRINALRHCNLVVRAEVPDMGIQKDDDTLNVRIREELSILKKRMRESGAPLSDTEEKMATYELVMMHTTMRYVVGIHRDLQVALDHSAGVTKYMQKLGVKNQKGSAFFIQRVMQALHLTPEQLASLEGDETSADYPSVERLERTEAMQRPVLPYTYMLKCCLWFNIPSGSES
ncbi:unnamed protein product [Phytomonas sp. EM1]|nr:unnamed protein product [Phytomonas sp. EM1]|eukprot:CCW60017.1 unnamed protein product [Phytomonas sp. isolate EM1]